MGKIYVGSGSATKCVCKVDSSGKVYVGSGSTIRGQERRIGEVGLVCEAADA